MLTNQRIHNFLKIKEKQEYQRCIIDALIDKKILTWKRWFVARVLDFLATGFCGLVNLSGPSFQAVQQKGPGAYFFVAGRHLSQKHQIAVNEAKNQLRKGESQLELELEKS